MHVMDKLKTKIGRKPVCNLCGSEKFDPIGKDRPLAKCANCRSFERTRIMKLILDDLGLPKKNSRILHFAPDKGMYGVLKGPGYQPVDLSPELFDFVKVKRFDITTDIEKLPSKKYDLIIHSHVMEHIPCDVTAVLYHIHRALKPGGWHVFCIPVLSNTTYAEDLGEISEEYATKEFGQFDHVRRWGSNDIYKTLGMALKLPGEYNLEKKFGKKTLKSFAIPEYTWRGWQPSVVLALKRNDMKLISGS